MRRWVKRIPVCLALGVLTTVALPWVSILMRGAAPVGPSLRVNRVILIDREPSIDGVRERDWISDRYRLRTPSSCLCVAIGPEVALADWAVSTAEGALTAEDFDLTLTAYGWPFRCVQSSERKSRIDLSSTVLFTGYTPPTATNTTPARFPLPHSPIVRGLALSSIFYAILLAGLIPFPRILIRWRRQQRNQCGGCGYCLVGLHSSRCPECGDSVIASWAQPKSAVVVTEP